LASWRFIVFFRCEVGVSEPLRVAVVGVGWAGSRQVEAIRELGGGIEVVCLVDSDVGFLRERVEEFGVGAAYTELAGALADPAVEAVSICLPHDLHEGAAIAAARAGKHILCEKPLAPTVEGASRILAAAEATGVKVYVAENAGQFAYPAHPLSDYAQEIAAFADYVRRGVVGPTTGASERRSVAVVQAGYESAAHGRPVDLWERFGAL
jgi:predicted dehydrogenase